MSDPFDPLLGAPPADAGDVPIDLDDLPGADQPAWLLPTLVVAFGALIAWLVIFGQDGEVENLALSGEPGASVAAAPAAESPAGVDDPTTPTVASEPAPEASSEPAPAPETTTVDPGGDQGDVVDPVGDAQAAAAVTTSPDAIEVDLPPAGVVRVGDTEFPLLNSCVGVQPLAPNDTAATITAHVFRPDGEREQVVERWATSTGITGVRVDGPGATGLRQVDLVDATVPGAFAATFERPEGGIVDLVVNPLPESEQDCSDAVVTNAPGQFAFPYTRPVLASCVAGDPRTDGRVVAVLTEGARMIAEANGDDTHTLTLRSTETLISPQAVLVDRLGSLFADGDRLGYSGLVSDGDTSFDLTFDVDVATSRPCTDDDV